MKILMLTPYLPYPPSSGGQVRSYNLLKHLSKHHDIYLVSLIKNNEEKKYHKDLLPYCKEIYVCMRSENPWTPLNIIKSVFGRYPFLVVRNYSRQSQDVISNLLKKEQFDLIHAETFYIMPHIPQTNVPILLVEQTIEYQVYQHFVSRLTPLIRPLFYFDIHKLKYWEIEYWKRADLVGAVSQEDKKQMSELMSEQKIEIIPNGAGEDLLPLYKKIKESQPIFLYQGNFSWLQNVEAADILVTQIFPEIKKKVADARCIIAGQRASEKLKSLKGNSVEIVDISPSQTEKVIDVYSRASIFLAPIEGPGGTRLKILGAMAAGLPVISSSTGVSGLDVENGRHVAIARLPEDFARQAKKLLTDKNYYNRVRSSARALIEKKYSWTTISQELEKIYGKLTNKS